MSDITPQSLGLGLSINHAQEQFSKAFVLAVAALAGCSAAEPEPDVDDIDWTLSCRLAPRRPKLDLQVKSWTQNAGTPEALHYPLRRKSYDGLILTTCSFRGFWSLSSCRRRQKLGCRYRPSNLCSAVAPIGARSPVCPRARTKAP